MSNNLKNNTADNYFSLLGLALSFDIDKTLLNHNYHEIQKSIHPDNFATATDLERRLSVQKAAQINDALETLKNPLRRSIYLLSLYDVVLSDNDTSIDPAFLMEQMELRENLSEVDSKDDPLGELDDILDDVNSRIKQTITILAGLFEKLLSDQEPSADDKEPSADDKEPSADDKQESEGHLLTEAKALALKMQFLNRLQEECLNKEEDLADQL